MKSEQTRAALVAVVLILLSGAAAAGPAEALFPEPASAPAGKLVIRGVVRGPAGPFAGADVIATPDSGVDLLALIECPADWADWHCGEKLLACRCLEAANRFADLAVKRRGEVRAVARAKSGPGGAYALAGLAPGAYVVWAFGPGGVTGVREGARAGLEGADVELFPGHTIRGKVVDGFAIGLSGVAVTVTDLGRHRYFSTRSGPEGFFELGPLPAGSYDAAATAPNLLPDHERVGEKDVTLRLLAPRRIAGRVSQGGAPALGARLQLIGMHRKLSTDADAAGAFAFTGLRNGGYAILATRGKWLAFTRQDLTHDKDIGDVRFDLEEGGDIAGVVRGPDGAPVAGARVEATKSSFDRVETGADGAYRVGPFYAERQGVTASAPGYQRTFASTEVKAGQVAPLDVTLVKAAALKGKVVGADGAGVAGAKVEAFMAAEAMARNRRAAASATTGADGAFALDGLGAGAYELSVKAKGQPDSVLDVKAPVENLVVKLARGLVVSGAVVDHAGKGIPQATLVLAAENGETRREARADDAGRFAFDGVPAGKYLVTATREERRTGKERVVSAKVEVGEKPPAALHIQFARGAEIAGRVVDAAGKPMSNTFVSAYPAIDPTKLQQGAPPAMSVGSARAGDDGKFVIAELDPGAYRVTAQRSAAASEPVKAKTGDRDLKLVLPRHGLLQGVVLGPDGEPIKNFAINGAWVETLAGHFWVVVLKDEEAVAWINAYNYAPAFRRARVKVGEEVTLPDVVLSLGRTVRGRAVDAATGAPVAGAKVGVSARNALRAGDEMPADDPLLPRAGRVKTQADGTFQFDHVEEGTLLAATHPGYLLAEAAVPAGDGEVVLRLSKGASISGRVTTSGGQPLEGLTVVAEGAGGEREARTGKDGRYEIGGLAPGSYSVSVEHGGGGPYEPAEAKVEVAAQGASQSDFKNRAGTATMRLLIAGAVGGEMLAMLVKGDVPALGSETDLRRFADGAIPAVPDQGFYFFHGVEAGHYTLFVIRMGREGPGVFRLPVDLKADKFPNSFIQLPEKLEPLRPAAR